MQQVAVLNNFQKSGIGTAITRYCENYAASHKYKKIYAYARETALPFYIKIGYMPEGIAFIRVTIPHQKVVKIL